MYRAYQKYFPSIKLKEPKTTSKHVPYWVYLYSITFAESRHGELERNIDLS